jgi:hypothetical protein
MYGKWYDYVVNKKAIPDITSITNDCIRYHDFLLQIQPYVKNDIHKYNFKCNFSDNTNVNDFVLTHSREYNSKSNPIFFLNHYNYPIWKFNIPIDTIIFKDKINKLVWRGSTTGNYDIKQNVRYNIISTNFKKTNMDIGFNKGVQMYSNYKEKFDELMVPFMDMDLQKNFKDCFSALFLDGYSLFDLTLINPLQKICLGSQIHILNDFVSLFVDCFFS